MSSRRGTKTNAARIPHTPVMRHKVAAGHWFANKRADIWFHPDEKCDSPIEHLLIAALRTIGAVRGDNLTVYSSVSLVWLRQYVGEGIFAGLQTVVGPYRVDIALVTKGRLVIVECDGHDFHSKSKKFAARDKARDRYLAEEGATVLRFTGSEIWTDSFKCAEQALKIAGSVFA